MSFYDFLFNDSLLFEDEGKKGMRHGKHIMARDPEYLLRLKNNPNAISVKRATYLGSIKGQANRNFKAFDRVVNNTLKPDATGKDFKRLERANRPKSIYNKGAEFNRLLYKIKQRKKLKNEAKAASEASRAAGHNITSAKVNYGSDIKINPSNNVKVKKYFTPEQLSRYKKIGLASTLGAAALGGVGYLAYKHRGDSAMNVNRIIKDYSIIRKINFLKSRRHADKTLLYYLKNIKLTPKTKVKLALAIGGGVIGGGIIGTALGALLGKYIFIPIAKNTDLKAIRNGKIPEETYVKFFKNYFMQGSSVIKKFAEPEIWDDVSERNFIKLVEKVNSAKKVRDLMRIFPNSKQLVLVDAAYKEARASGHY